MKLEKFIGQNMRGIRKSNGTTQEEICLKADLTQARYSELENGKASPNLRTLERVAKALEVPIAELFKEPIAKNQSLRDKLEAVSTLSKQDQLIINTVIEKFLNAKSEKRKKKK